MLTIERATRADLGAITALRWRWTEEDAGRDDPASVPDAEFVRHLADWWETVGVDRAVFLAEERGEPVGMLNLAFFDRMPKPGRPISRWAYLGNAFVLPELRSRGVGSRLLRAALGHARELGCVRVVLSPTERSKALYRRAGFGPADVLLVHPLDD
ncbi:MAG TPA: GNAT family N-acetyltransferase [Pseudonocardia sp.]|nr:GNAT family N-acetyltransferase [Pseudonocardia sp.]